MCEERCCGFISFSQINTDFCRFLLNKQQVPETQVWEELATPGIKQKPLSRCQRTWQGEPSLVSCRSVSAHFPVRKRGGQVWEEGGGQPPPTPFGTCSRSLNVEHPCGSLSSLTQLCSHLPVTGLSCGVIFRPTGMSCLMFCGKHQECVCFRLFSMCWWRWWRLVSPEGRIKPPVANSVYLQKLRGHHMALKVRSLLCVGGDRAQDPSLVDVMPKPAKLLGCRAEL